MIFLVVEDHRETAMAMRRLLEFRGERVEVVYDCAAARELVRRITPDVLLCDIHLPDGTGIELLEELRPRFPSLCAIAVTGTMHGEIDSLRKHGFAHVVSKPFRFDDLERAVEHVCLSHSAPATGGPSSARR